MPPSMALPEEGERASGQRHPVSSGVQAPSGRPGRPADALRPGTSASPEARCPNRRPRGVGACGVSSAPPQISGHLELEFLPGPVQPRHDSAGGDVQRLSDLLVAQVLISPQREDSLLLGGKSAERLLEPLLHLFSLDKVGRRFVRRGQKIVPGHFFLLGQRPFPLSLFEIVEAVVEGDPPDPGKEGMAVDEMRERQISLYEGVLGEIVCSLMGAGDVVAQDINRPLVFPDQGFERVHVSLLGSRYKISFNAISCPHWRSRPLYNGFRGVIPGPPETLSAALPNS